MLRRRMLLQQARLPAEYQEVEWIESNGNQWIDTGVKPFAGKITVEFELTMSSIASSYHILGAQTTGSEVQMFAYSPDYLYARYASNTSGDNMPIHPIYANTKYKAYMENNTGTSYLGVYGLGSTSNPNRGTNFSQAYNIYVFARNLNGTADQMLKGKIYSLVFETSSGVINEFVPCYRKSDSVIGMYDIVGRQFYTNQGSGTFTCGPGIYPFDLKFNQLLDNGNFASTSGWGSWSISITASDNICHCTATGTSGNAFLQRYSYIQAGHKYLCVATVKHSKNARMQFSNAYNWSTGVTVTANQWQTIGCFLNPVGGGGTLYTYMNTNGNVVGDTCEFKNMMVIDLTSMYGEGNEPTNFEIIKADCANIGHPLTEWQPYTPRT